MSLLVMVRVEMYGGDAVSDGIAAEDPRSDPVVDQVQCTSQRVWPILLIRNGDDWRNALLRL
jgi:hypothetical protein